MINLEQRKKIKNVQRILNKSYRAFSYEKNIDKLFEECAEVINAIQRYKYNRGSAKEVLEEICDLFIITFMILMEEYFGKREYVIDMMNEKCCKLEKQIDNIVKKPHHNSSFFNNFKMAYFILKSFFKKR